MKSYLRGSTSSLYLCAAQELWHGTVNPDGTIAWDAAALGRSPVAGGADFHADLWDFHVTADGHSWVANDGGIYAYDPSTRRWADHNEQLHTHHSAAVTALPTAPAAANVAYTTHDNGGWARAAGAPEWKLIYDGDIALALGDAAVPAMALLVRHRESAVVTTFGAPPPAGSQVADNAAFKLNYYKEQPDGSADDNSFGGGQGEAPFTIRFVQTLEEEAPKPLLDLVMLADLPLTHPVGTPVINEPFDETRYWVRRTPRGNLLMMATLC